MNKFGNHPENFSLLINTLKKLPLLTQLELYLQNNNLKEQTKDQYTNSINKELSHLENLIFNC